MCSKYVANDVGFKSTVTNIGADVGVGPLTSLLRYVQIKRFHLRLRPRKNEVHRFHGAVHT